MTNKDIKERPSGYIRFTRVIERVGNKIPDPIYLFIGLILIVMLISAIFNGSSVSYMTTDETGAAVEASVSIVNICSKEGIATFISNMQTNYKNISTLSLILLAVMGASVFEHSGFVAALVRKSLLSVSPKAVTYILCVVGVCANILGEAGTVLATTLGCLIYKSIGRNPWVGGITAYAAAAAGFTANLLPGVLDVTYYSITLDVCEKMGIPTDVNMLSNYIFMVVATFAIAAVISLLSETFLSRYFKEERGTISQEVLESSKVTPAENRGLRFALVAFLVLLAITLWCTVPKNGLLRAADGTLLPKSPFMNGMVVIMVIYFITLGVAYGIGAGTIKKANDVPKLMRVTVQQMSSMWILLFFVAQLMYVISATNLSNYISYKGQELLTNIGLTGFSLLLVYIIVISIVNLFIPSASAKWLMLAPVFIPMLNSLGIDPIYTQVATRIADSCTNSITPLMATLFITIQILNENRDTKSQPEEAGTGTILATVLPFALAVEATFIVLLFIFMKAGLPLGF